MFEQSGNSPWDQPGWFERAEAWIRMSLEAQGRSPQAEIEQIHTYPWSIVLRIQSEADTLYFKATAKSTTYEAAFSAYLKTLHPNGVPDLFATNPDAGWMIMFDGGKRLRETLQVDLDFRYWEQLLPQYAALQIQASADRDKLLSVGIPDRTLANFPQLFRHVIKDQALYQPQSEDALSDQDYQRLVDLIPVVEAKAGELAHYAIPETIHHGDLHDGNVFYDGIDYVFFDWGDVCLSHPFFSLRTAYVSAEMRFNLDENAPELHRLRDAYLPAWRDFETEGRLLQAFDLARELWAVSSLLSWHQQIKTLKGETLKTYQHILPSLARELFSLIKA